MLDLDEAAAGRGEKTWLPNTPDTKASPYKLKG